MPREPKPWLVNRRKLLVGEPAAVRFVRAVAEAAAKAATEREPAGAADQGGDDGWTERPDDS